MEAATGAGATLDELYKWSTGQYPSWFMARVVVWWQMHRLIETHTSDASMKGK